MNPFKRKADSPDVSGRVMCYVEVKRYDRTTRHVKAVAAPEERQGVTAFKVEFETQATEYAAYNQGKSYLEAWANDNDWIVDDVASNINLPKVNMAKGKTYSRN